MATHPLNLPAVADDIVSRVNQALTLEARIDEAVAKADQALADSGTSVTVTDNGNGTFTLSDGTTP